MIPLKNLHKINHSENNEVMVYSSKRCFCDSRYFTQFYFEGTQKEAHFDTSRNNRLLHRDSVTIQTDIKITSLNSKIVRSHGFTWKPKHFLLFLNIFCLQAENLKTSDDVSVTLEFWKIQILTHNDVNSKSVRKPIVSAEHRRELSATIHRRLTSQPRPGYSTPVCVSFTDTGVVFHLCECALQVTRIR